MTPALDRLLAGELDPGVYQWPSAPTADKVKVVAESAGWRFIELDTATVVDKAGMLDAAAKTFGFPAYFGRNYDAFADSLTEVRGESGVLVLWDGWAGLAELNPHTTGLTLDVFTGRCAASSFGPFAVLIVGSGPVLDVPELE
jgi:barstar (barnase inhibitor)